MGKRRLWKMYTPPMFYQQENTQESNVSAFHKGKMAAKRGEDIDANPNDEKNTQWDEWEDGWAAGKESEEE